MSKTKWEKSGQARRHRKGMVSPRPKGVISDAGNERGCSRKVAYAKKIALKVAKKVRKNTGEPVWPYRCGNCNNWHIGHDYKRAG